MIELSPHLASSFGEQDPFDAVMGLQGEVFREHKHRRTVRVVLDGRAYFVKIHGHTSLLEILKNAFRARWPVLTAKNERDAIRRLTSLGIPTMRIAGYGCRGRPPGRLNSFIITDALDGTTSLEEISAAWCGLAGRARFRFQRVVIAEVGRIARTLHRNGLNHRDFYLCHFLLADRDWSQWSPAQPLKIHIIDLHRAQCRRRVPQRWVVKDLAGLLFSSLDAGLTSRDYLRFLEEYDGRPWREIVSRQRGLCRQTVRRAVRLYRAQHGRPPRLPRALASFA